MSAKANLNLHPRISTRSRNLTAPLIFSIQVAYVVPAQNSGLVRRPWSGITALISYSDTVVLNRIYNFRINYQDKNLSRAIVQKLRLYAVRDTRYNLIDPKLKCKATFNRQNILDKFTKKIQKISDKSISEQLVCQNNVYFPTSINFLYVQPSEITNDSVTGKSVKSLGIIHRHSLAHCEYIKWHDSFNRAFSLPEIIWEPLCSRANTHVQALVLIDGGLHGTPRTRARSWQGRGVRKAKEYIEIEKRGRERWEMGSKAQKNSVARHGAESTPKIHSRVPHSHMCKVARIFQNTVLDSRCNKQ